MARVVFRPKGEVPLLGQTTCKCCWHTCYKMLYGWKGRPMSEVDRRIPNPGHKGTPTEKGLKPSQFKWACKKMGLYGYPTASLTQIRMAWILRKCGPIWTTGKFLSGRLHTVVIAALRLDPVEVLIHDPWENYPLGRADWESYSWWEQKVCTVPFSNQIWW